MTETTWFKLQCDESNPIDITILPPESKVQSLKLRKPTVRPWYYGRKLENMDEMEREDYEHDMKWGKK